MRMLERWDQRNQRWADRAETRRQKLPGRTEVRAKDGSRFAVEARERGTPDRDWYTGVFDSFDLALDCFFWLRHRLRYRGAWLVKIVALDERGFDQEVVRGFVVASRAHAREAISEVVMVLGSDGLSGVDARIASGHFEAA